MTSDTASSTSSDRLLLESDTRVTCPACKHDFGLAEGFAKKALEQFTQASKDMAAKEKALAEREQGLQKQIDKEATEKAQRLIAGEKQYLEGELKDKLAQIAGYQAAELELRKEKNKLADEKAAVELDVQRRVDNERTAIEEKTRLAETEKSKLREGELKKKIDDMSDKLAEAQRKAAQGSQQLQGEVLEVLLEDQLREAFPFDTIEEVKKGARGGDVIQRVMTRAGQLAGSILWEAKRTTTWVKDWTAKLKDDPEGGRRGGWRHCQCDSPEGVCARTAVRTL